MAGRRTDLSLAVTVLQLGAMRHLHRLSSQFRPYGSQKTCNSCGSGGGGGDMTATLTLENRKETGGDISPQCLSYFLVCFVKINSFCFPFLQENVYIDELTELISVSIADMNSLSVKPDKCAVLQETVKQTRKLLEQDDADEPRSSSNSPPTSGNSSSGGSTSSLAVALATVTASDEGGGPGQVLALQQGEVSSSKPALLDTQMMGTFLLEALDGFLFVVNTEGKTEYVSDNVTHFLHYQPQDLVGKPIYNIIHHGDLDRFSFALRSDTAPLGKSHLTAATAAAMGYQSKCGPALFRCIRAGSAGDNTKREGGLHISIISH